MLPVAALLCWLYISALFGQCSSTSRSNIVVALTRSQKDNSSLRNAIESEIRNHHGTDTLFHKFVDIPCIAFGVGPDVGVLQNHLMSKNFDAVVLTSPQAATVFREVCNTLHDPQVKVVVANVSVLNPV